MFNRNSIWPDKQMLKNLSHIKMHFKQLLTYLLVANQITRYKSIQRSIRDELFYHAITRFMVRHYSCLKTGALYEKMYVDERQSITSFVAARSTISAVTRVYRV